MWIYREHGAEGTGGSGDVVAGDDTATTTAAAPDSSDWKTGLPEDLRVNEQVAKFGSVSDLAKGYVNLEKQQGNRVAIPGEGASEEEVRAFYTKMGCPESPDGYEVPSELPEGVQVDESLAANWFSEAHKMGLTRQQAARAIRFQVELASQAAQAQGQAAADARAATETALKQEWGQAYDERMAMANEAMDRLENRGAKGLKDLVSSSEYGDAKPIVQALAIVGKYMMQDPILGKGAGAESFETSPGEARRALAKHQLDQDWMGALMNSSHPSHAEVNAEWQRLQLAAHAAADVPGEGPIQRTEVVVRDAAGR